MSKHSKTGSGLDGLLLIDKGRGYTSHDLVRMARRALGQKKIGHCGTLDPEATGLLLLTVGRGTRLTRFLIRAPKVYEGTITLGVETDTYDAAGEVTATSDPGAATLERIREIMASFQGPYQQTPPAYCAKKIKGEKYYELARRGEETPQEPKEVRVFEFSPLGEMEDGVVEGESSYPVKKIAFRLACSSGTYARALAEHLGRELGCGGHLSALRRHTIGNFELASAAPLEELERCEGHPERLGEAWVSFDDIPLPFPQVEADLKQERRIQHGQTMLVPEFPGEEGDWVKVINGRSEFIAVGTVIERLGEAGTGVVQPRIVFKS